MFVFMGVCYSLVGYGFIGLMLYFLLQAVSSLNVFVFFTMSLDSVLLAAIFLKLSMFPFMFWYLPVFSKLPNFVLFLASSFHKVPSFVIVSKFLASWRSSLVFAVSFATILTRGVLIFSMNNLRLLVILSSVGNNSWMLLAALSSVECFCLFFVVYRARVYAVICYFKSFYKTSIFRGIGSTALFSAALLSVAGFPPFPLFYSKLLVVLSVLSEGVFRSVLLVLFLLAAVVMIGSYLRFCFVLITNLFQTAPCFAVL